MQRRSNGPRWRTGLVAATALAALALPGTPAMSLAGDPAEAAAHDHAGHPNGGCGALEAITVDGPVGCTHGPDPAPPGIDISQPWPARSSQPEFEPTEAAAVGSVPCIGDGVSGKRVQAIYAHPADRPNRASQVVPQIRTWAAETDAVINISAQKRGATRHVRFVTRSDCTLDVKVVTLTAQGDDNLTNTVAELRLQGFDRTDRKYLVWMDSTVLCGIASLYIDDRPTKDNANNSTTAPPTVARVDSGCWGLASRGQSVEAHELVHGLGGVQPTAPNATANSHCNDESDRMCYADGSPGYAEWTRCDVAREALLDCGGDDYFHPSPPAGSYLATHWNTANSDLLASSDVPPPPPDKLTRLAGSTRVETAIRTSRDAFPTADSATAAVLASDRSFADALPGVPLASAEDGPLLLNGRDRLDPAVAQELQRVLPARATVYLLGGTGALGDAVARGVQALGFTTTRFAGENRYATAVAIAEHGLGAPDTVFEATGHTFADALTGGSAAAAVGGAILLTDGSTQSVETAAYIARHPTARRYALGGPARAADPAATAFAGRDRYATASAVARHFFSGPRTIGVASGLSFPDALAGGANIAIRNGPMLLVAREAPLPAATVDYVRSQSAIDHSVVYGGTGVVSDRVAYELANLIPG
ncbi:MAG TPA: cell wall-binding repeat-containing protein [Acidimicrobiales bacterium]|nr:cell wall-binding repeat-containing protein [Acidimicrobiales bacterium]